MWLEREHTHLGNDEVINYKKIIYASNLKKKSLAN